MAQLSTGIPRSNFGQANVNYNLLAQGTLAGEQVKLAASQQKNNRIRANIANVQAQRELDNVNAGKISSLLASNPDLMNQAPEQVQQAEEKFLKTGGSTNTNALLLSYLGDTQQRKLQADALAQQDQILAFQQAQTELANETSLANAKARRQTAINANRPDAETFTQEQINDFKNSGLIPKDLTPAGTNTEGAQLFKGEFNEGKIYTQEEVIQARSDGLDLKGQVLPDGNVFVTGFNSVDGSTVRMDEAQQEAFGVMGKAAGAWFAAENGGAIKAQANLDTYLDVIADLESGEVETGTVTDKLISFVTVGGLDNNLRSIFKPKDQNAIELVRGIVFQGLRETLGAQFTEREGQRLVETSYNPNLTAKQNIKRLKRLAAVLKGTMDFKNKFSDSVLSGNFAEQFVKGGIIKPIDYYNGAVAQMEYEFKQQDEMLNKGNPNGYRFGTSDVFSSDGATVEFE